MNIFVGTAGFSYKDWEGVVYPADLKMRKIHPLEYLAQFFDCCEINTSFYGHIRPNVGKSWCEKTAAVNPNFQFTAKLFQGFTHIPRGAKSSSPFQLTVSPKDQGLTREGLDSIGTEGRLGAVLVQFSRAGIINSDSLCCRSLPICAFTTCISTLSACKHFSSTSIANPGSSGRATWFFFPDTNA